MALEIERKFRVRDDSWRSQAHASRHFEQGYLCGKGPASVRVRIEDEHANLNIKAARIGRARSEYEYPIPIDDAREMITELSLTPPVIKTRYWVDHAGHTWEVDVFEGENAPLVVAEVELETEDEAIEWPSWVGEEITDDARYYNHALAFHPYGHWPGNAQCKPRVEIDLAAQTLTLFDANDQEIAWYSVSTAIKGAGECEGSHQTPRGRHRIRAMIGSGAAPGTVFRGRRPTGEIHSPELAEQYPERDWILTRILWLCGEEVGFNRLGTTDTMRRYIYIHGAPDATAMGRPGSIGCIRMHNADVVDLFDRVMPGTPVLIHE